MTVRIGFVGFGEVGSTFAADLLKADGVSLCAYDVLFDQTSSRPAERARALGVLMADSTEAVCKNADIVISAVTAASAREASAEAALMLSVGGIYFDVNSVSPESKRHMATMFRDPEVFVEGAVMAPVAGIGTQVHILGGGKRVNEVAAKLNPRGFNIEAFSTEIGPASAAKLCRSVVIKGMEALVSVSAQAAAHWGVLDQVFESLRRSPPSIDPAYVRERLVQHGRRRADEMLEAALMVDAQNIDPMLCKAAAARILQIHNDANFAPEPTFKSFD